MVVLFQIILLIFLLLIHLDLFNILDPILLVLFILILGIGLPGSKIGLMIVLRLWIDNRVWILFVDRNRWVVIEMMASEDLFLLFVTLRYIVLVLIFVLRIAMLMSIGIYLLVGQLGLLFLIIWIVVLVVVDSSVVAIVVVLNRLLLVLLSENVVFFEIVFVVQHVWLLFIVFVVDWIFSVEIYVFDGLHIEPLARTVLIHLIILRYYQSKQF